MTTMSLYVNDNVCHMNRMQHQYDYAADWQVLKKVHYPTKLEVKSTGSHAIEHAHMNGMFIINLYPGLTKCINVCNVKEND
jgi:hypothetical protein